MSIKEKVEFESNGVMLAGSLERPDGDHIVPVALFAHCFTCGMDVLAAARVSRELVARGYAVLRFDFTGIGNSDGEFADTNFSSNVADLIAAADFLRHNYEAPRLLVGHSLGGAAVLTAAHHIPECQAVASIAGPAHAQHVAKQFKGDIEEIENTGEATVDLAGREFIIRKQFLDDIRSHSLDDIGKLDAAILILHSPLDKVVSINEAEKIYKAARHPKSFISLDTADHFLLNRKDAQYAATCIAAWATRFIDEDDA